MSVDDERECASTPPMGWNSWDCFGNSVTEGEVLANARFMSERMLGVGWDTVVVDIQWHDPKATGTHYNPRAQLVLDEYGRPEPAVNRFPSAEDNNGFGPLADKIHEMGLKFGLHIMRGVPRLAVERGLPIAGTALTAADIADRKSTCDWNGDNYGIDHSKSGAERYYESVIEKFAGWGVDFVKVDDMIGPYHADEISAFSRAVRRSLRPMVLSLSPGRSLSLVHAEHLRDHADMWRVSADLWDRWSDVYSQFDRLSQWSSWSKPGSWPDADMIPLGHIGIRAEEGPGRRSRLTPDEQTTLMTLWCFARSPLMFGGDLPTSDPDTIALLTKPELLDVHRYGLNQQQLLREGEVVIWGADDSRGHARHIAIFNLNDHPVDYAVPFTSIGAEENDLDGLVDPVWGLQLSGRLDAHASTFIKLPSRNEVGAILPPASSVAASDHCRREAPGQGEMIGTHP